MRVAIVSRDLHGLGGMEVFCRDLIDHLAREGIDVQVISTAYPGDAGTFHKVVVGTEPKLSTMAFVMKSARLIRDIRPNVVNIHALDGHASLALLLPGRVIISQHGYHHFRLGRLIQRLRPSTEFLANSRWSEQVLLELGHIRCSGHAYPVPRMPCDTDRSAARSKLGFNEDETIVLHVGRCVPFKGQMTLLRAALRCRKELRGQAKLRFVLVGEGELRSRFEDFVIRSGLSEHVLLAGAVPHEDIHEWFAASDIYVQPSVFDARLWGVGESFGITVIEAMASGLPLVLTDSDIFRELVQESECACLFPPGDDDVLARQILQLIRDPRMRARMGQCATRHARTRFSPRAAWATYSALLREGPGNSSAA